MMWARIEDGAVREVITFDPAGRFHESLVWVECPGETAVGDRFDGQGFSKPVPPPPLPLVVSPRQIRQALTFCGQREVVESGVAAADQDTKDWWEFATQFEENHPRVVAMCQQLAISDEDRHAVFVKAAAL